MPPPVIVHLVPHTHWDREWYLPFQTFRARLVRLVDGLLAEMELDERVRFTLDGQTATVDDYLEIRPEARGALERLVRSGRLSVGPWHILMDEFLVSGETIVRNLELGWRTAEGLGPPLRVGYLPDMFGHIAQMPQILRRAGILDAVVWRGVPKVVDHHVFTWRSPDGSEVRCEYLYGGYGNARDLFVRADGVADRLDTYQELVGEFFGEDELLAMYGEDHSIPRPGYAALAAETNASQERYRIVIETLAEYLGATRNRSLPTKTWTGELRSSARANILMGVVSHHGDVRIAAARAERALERYAEPFAALHAASWPRTSLDLAWRRVIEDSAHDSICACSADDVVAQVLVRYAEAEQIAQTVIDGMVASVATNVALDGWLVASPSPFARSDIVELSIDEPEAGHAGDRVAVDHPSGVTADVQEIDRAEVVLDDVHLRSGDVPGYLRLRLHGREIYRAYVVAWSLDRDSEPPVLTLRGLPEDRPPGLDVDAMLRELDQHASADPQQVWRVRVERLPRRRLLARVETPALGWTAVRPRLVGPRVAPAPVSRGQVHLDRGGLSIGNDLIGITVESDGRLSIDAAGVRLRGVGRLVDGGDVGDAYNYGPPPRDVLVETPDRVAVRVEERGPLRGRLLVTRTYRWPQGLTPDAQARDERSMETEVAMTVEVRAGEPFVRLSIGFENRAVDHRLRFCVPLPAAVDRSWAEGQFAIVERGLTMEGGHGEHPVPTFPAHGLAAVDGVAVLLDAVAEYEVVDDGRELAITLLRATGLISRDANPWRADPAGPMLPTPSAQRIGRVEASFALLPHLGAPGAMVLRALEAYRHPFVVARGGGFADPPLVAVEGLSVEGDGVVVTALRRVDGGLELRLVNETPGSAPVTVRGPFTASRECDLLGAVGPTLPVQLERGGRGAIHLRMGPWEIRTLRFEALELPVRPRGAH